MKLTSEGKTNSTTGKDLSGVYMTAVSPDEHHLYHESALSLPQRQYARSVTSPPPKDYTALFMKLFITLTVVGALALGVHAGCREAQLVDHRLQAYCTDEATGFDFIYDDLDGHVAQEASIGLQARTNVADSMYNAYLSGISNTTILSRSDSGKWKICKDKVAGVCSNKHVIAWTGSGSALIGAITGVYASVNHKSILGSKPRSKCTQYKGDGTICVSWAAYYHSEMSTAQIQDISRECEIECGKNKLSCESRLVTDASVQYYCVSNRATGCTANNSIDHC